MTVRLPVDLLPVGLITGELDDHGEGEWPPPGTSIGTFAPCRHRVWLHCAIDSSGSVTSMNGADPVGRRFEELGFALRRWARSCRCRDRLVTVHHFDPGYAVGPVQVSSRTIAADLQQALQVPGGAGSSNLGSAASAISADVRRAPDHTHVAVVLSDGQLFDTDPQGVVDGLAREVDVLHAIVVGDKSWVTFDQPGSTATPLTEYSAPGAAAAAVVDALNAATACAGTVKRASARAPRPSRGEHHAR